MINGKDEGARPRLVVKKKGGFGKEAVYIGTTYRGSRTSLRGKKWYQGGQDWVQKDGKWHEVYFQRVPTDIWSLGYNEETNQLFMSGRSESFELVIPFKQINRLPQVRLCQTTMPSGAINNSNC